MGLIEIVVGLKNAAFNKGLSDMRKQAETFKKDLGKSISGSIGGLLSVGAITAGVKSLVSFGDALSDSADRLNLTTDSVQGLAYAFSQGGATGEAFEKGMLALNGAIESAKEGNAGALASFDKLGISFADLSRENPEQILLRMADAMKDAKDPGKALAAVMDLLGKSGAQMIPTLKSGADEIARMSAEASKLSSTQIAELAKADEAFTRFFQKIRTNGAAMIAEFRDNPLLAIFGEGQSHFDERVGDVRTPDATKMHGYGGPAADDSIPLSPAEQAAEKAAEKQTEEAKELWQNLEDFKRKAANQRLDDEKAAAEKQAKEAETLYTDLEDFKRQAANQRIDDEKAAKEKAAAEDVKRAAAAAEDEKNARDKWVDGQLSGPDARRQAKRDEQRRERLESRYDRLHQRERAPGQAGDPKLSSMDGHLSDIRGDIRELARKVAVA